MTSSISDLPLIVEDLADLERLFGLMGTYGVAVVEIGGLKVVRPPDVPQPAVRANEAGPERRVSGPIHEDPFLYGDGAVPSFGL